MITLNNEDLTIYLSSFLPTTIHTHIYLADCRPQCALCFVLLGCSFLFLANLTLATQENIIFLSRDTPGHTTYGELCRLRELTPLLPLAGSLTL